tara:strand:+ start:724 stop:1050 length:327 start_codon:yes stop_codon:yes gene_type:complete
LPSQTAVEVPATEEVGIEKVKEKLGTLLEGMNRILGKLEKLSKIEEDRLKTNRINLEMQLIRALIERTNRLLNNINEGIITQDEVIPKARNIYANTKDSTSRLRSLLE